MLRDNEYLTILDKALNEYINTQKMIFNEVDKGFYKEFKNIVEEAKIVYEPTKNEPKYYVIPYFKKKKYAYKDVKTLYRLSSNLTMYNLTTEKITIFKTISVNKYLINDLESIKKELLLNMLILNKNKHTCYSGKVILVFYDYDFNKALETKGYPEATTTSINYEFSQEEIDNAEQELLIYFASLPLAKNKSLKERTFTIIDYLNKNQPRGEKDND